ncbi:hypothetical protein B0H65DRAFT_573817 [Neurospora tetraspora]|uniref:RanBP2-type domain-containing protein n=1 Tax=Neurospora tetraspora TaxID=94610 RepID=A0AAE0MRZ1_9PEZI|nr:hypothetical protein B0H65DRAFT_573817 [Neurospora tetraspora]
MRPMAKEQPSNAGCPLQNCDFKNTNGNWTCCQCGSPNTTGWCGGMLPSPRWERNALTNKWHTCSRLCSRKLQEEEKRFQMTDGKEIQGETQSAPGDGRDFGKILNRAMNRASGRLIALLQEELERLSSENELIEDIEETDEALSNLNLDNRKSGCRL